MMIGLFVLASLLTGSGGALAEPAALMAAAGAQFGAPGIRAPSDPDVDGFRFSILYGDNENMSGLDLGFVAMSESRTLSGVALVLGFHKLRGDMDGGAAFSFANFHGGSDSGLNAAFINKVNNAPDGVDFGFVNLADGHTMLDIGGLNLSDSSTAQLGFINITKKIEGFQLGFINIAQNGFLPVFPFFNFAVE
jgi:hypothetical protein